MITTLLSILLFTTGVAGSDQPLTVTSAGDESVTAAAQGSGDSPEALVAKMTSYQIGILRKGPKWGADGAAKLEALTKKKQEPWRKAAKAGHLVGVARVVEPADLVGIMFFKNQAAEEMKEIAGKAPAVTSGLLTAEIQKVWGTRGLGKGAAEKLSGEAKAALKKQSAFIVVATKGKNWSEKADAPETRTATQEQIKYLFGLFKSGALKFHCSLEDMTPAYRSLTILNAASEKEALDLLNGSPAAKNGWLTYQARKVTIPEGMLP